MVVIAMVKHLLTIPNREVKPINADDTTMCGKVGNCLIITERGNFLSLF